MTGEKTHRLIRVIAWLLTPVVAWAASFLGGWLGAVMGKGATHPTGGLLWLGTGALIGGVVGVAIWVVLLRRWTARQATTPPASQGAGE